ncbi:DUF4291 family protein [Streptomyces sp. NRRL S-646]|uniref:DUF4291 family protein n=1 Tax=Streptomyces sp. NRRL S-646 TaxID=1463917 RepID=UPI003B63DB53
MYPTRVAVTPGSRRISSSIPQKHPPASTALCVCAAIAVLPYLSARSLGRRCSHTIGIPCPPSSTREGSRRFRARPAGPPVENRSPSGAAVPHAACHGRSTARHPCGAESTITVYQAYAPEIGGPAVRKGRFPAAWKRDRMTWVIKPRSQSSTTLPARRPGYVFTR